MIKCPICSTEIEKFKTSDKGKSVIMSVCPKCGYITEFLKSLLDKYVKTTVQQDL